MIRTSASTALLLVAILVGADPAMASSCGDKARNLIRSYGLSEPAGGQPIKTGSAAEAGGTNPKSIGLSPAMQLTPVQRQIVQPQLSQAASADESGDTASCWSKLTTARHIISEK